MVRELLSQIEPLRLTATRDGRSVRRGKLPRLAALSAAAVILIAGYVWPQFSSFVSTAVVVLLVAGAAYVALAGELGDETTSRRTSAIFIVVTVGVVYGLYLLRQGSEPAVDPASVAIAVLLGYCAAEAYGQMVTRERGERWLDTALLRIRTPTAEAFELSLPFQSSGGVVWAIDPSRRALRAIAPDNDRSFIWDEPVRAVEIRRAQRAWWSSGDFRCDLVIRSGKDSVREWTYVFQFPGPHRATAARWRDVFENWMIEDQRRMAT